MLFSLPFPALPFIFPLPPTSIVTGLSVSPSLRGELRMERQRSFSVKSSSLLALSVAISSSILFLAVFSLWALRSAPPVLPEPHLSFGINITPTAAPSLITISDPTNFQSLAGGNFPRTSIFVRTHMRKPEKHISSGSWESSTEEVRRTVGKLVESDSQIVMSSDAVEALDWHKEKENPSAGVLQRDLVVGSNMLDSAPDPEQSSVEIKALDGMKKEENQGIKLRDCDLGKGRWVYDESYPLYTNWSCPFIDEGFNCGGNGRPDNGYMKWGWQPLGCQIPRFNATEMLEMLRGKRLVFVGDSINRNQWESMMCMLMTAVRDPKKVYETHARRITKEKGNYCFRFADYKCTVEYYVTHFLVHESKARIGQKRVPTLRIDSIDRGSSRWRGADILVFNSAHWWSHYKTQAGINYYQEGNQVHPKLDVSTAFRKALTTWASWVDKHVNARKTRVFFRSSAPSHFRGGEWNSGGHCKEAKLPLNAVLSTGFYSEKNIIAEEIIKGMKTPVTFLNITDLSSYRIDAHPSAYGGRPAKGRSSSGIQDCSHWCLPGVPDTWNELLYIHLLRNQLDSDRVAA
ncbi:hypothetical protein SAY87_023505 [Trapa incisa]|uniref:Trichome birefringence-like N-terminal domain-containing protein n=1 Tax=Trapa incisa TaxID=236973 RepID=A0AAN7L1B9_9MYRT|nr:hypothetical protein SAY87_023505 [Trapa incisa]